MSLSEWVSRVTHDNRYNDIIKACILNTRNHLYAYSRLNGTEFLSLQKPCHLWKLQINHTEERRDLICISRNFENTDFQQILQFTAHKVSEYEMEQIAGIFKWKVFIIHLLTTSPWVGKGRRDLFNY